MATIVIKTQAELDALPDSFAEYTRIEIHGGTRYDRIAVKKKWENSSVEARGNSSVVAWENSSVVARENSSVVAWGNSSVVAYQFALIAVLAATVVLKHLADYTVASLRGVDPKILKKDKTAKVVKTPTMIGLKISFETWLERGYVNADGIMQKLVSKKKRGKVEIFTVENFPQKKKSYVVKKGETFSHGETVEKAIEGLRYKLSDRDTSRFKKWKLDTKVSEEDAIQAYRAITGACEFGVKSFVESVKIPKSLTVKKVIELTSGRYGSEQFAKFFHSVA